MANGKRGQIQTVPIDRDKFIEAMKKRGTYPAEVSKEIGRSDSYIAKQIKNGRIDVLVIRALETWPDEKYRIPYDEVKPGEKEDETNPREAVEETRKTVMDKEEEILLFGMGDQNAYTPEEKKMIKVLVAANIQTFLRLTIPMETEIRRDALGTSTLIDIIERGVMAGMVRAQKKDCEENGNLKKIFADALNDN